MGTAHSPSYSLLAGSSRVPRGSSAPSSLNGEMERSQNNCPTIQLPVRHPHENGQSIRSHSRPSSPRSGEEADSLRRQQLAELQCGCRWVAADSHSARGWKANTPRSIRSANDSLSRDAPRGDGSLAYPSMRTASIESLRKSWITSCESSNSLPIRAVAQLPMRR